MDEQEEAYMKSKSEYLSIKDVEEGILYVKKYFKENFNCEVPVKYLKRLETRAERKVEKLFDMCQNHANIAGREAEMQFAFEEMNHHYSCIRLIRELAVINKLEVVKDLRFVNKKNLREQAEQVLKMESPESYQVYLKDKMEEKYGDTYGSFYR